MKGKKSPDEKQLIEGCRNGEAWAQKYIYELHAPTMMSVCMRYCGDYETARDILQEGFIKVFTKINSFADTGAFGGWIRRIMVTTALEHLRKNDVLKQSDDIDDHSMSFVDYTPDVLQNLNANDLMNCVAQLSDGYRTVFNMYAIEGYSHAEIADSLGISENTSRSQYMRARNILQKNVEQLLGKEYAKRYK